MRRKRRVLFDAATAPRVDYELTDLGHSLQGILAELTAWAFSHNGDVAAARREFDRGFADDAQKVP